MAKKSKNWREIVSNATLIRILDLIDEREGGNTPHFYKKTDISSGAFCTCLKRDSLPKVEMLLKVRSAYGVTLDWLVCGDGDLKEFSEKGSSGQTLESAAKIAKLEGRNEELEKKVQEYKDLSCKLLDKLPSKTLNKKREN